MKFLKSFLIIAVISVFGLLVFNKEVKAALGSIKTLVMRPGEARLFLDVQTAELTNVVCQGGYYPPGPNPYPNPNPSKTCDLRYAVAGSGCSYYQIYVNGQTMSECLYSLDSATQKQEQFISAGLCYPKQYPTQCDLRYNVAGSGCSYYQVYTNGHIATECLYSLEAAQTAVGKLRRAYVCN